MIKTILCTAALLASTLAGAADLTVYVDDVKTTDGNVTVAVFNSAESFLKKPMQFAGTPAALKGNVLTVKNLPEGEYAFVILHDANSNNKMDSNMIGIPTEDYAFSNNAMGKMGPPSYEAAKFTLPAAGSTMRVSLK
jgi:uncharacterized protein (DUF2141 family)